MQKMRIATKISEVREEIRKIKKGAVKIGFVPTMGYLHKGHLSLVSESMKECPATVVSIFVNPTQFGPLEDYNTYPRDAERDIVLLQKKGVNLLFLPSEEEIYGKSSLTRIEVAKLSERFEGSLRPGHFKGVCTVVCKFLNIVSPDKAYFGWKDAQQLIIIKQMVKDLNIPVEIKGCPTVREEDGLAASSRNVYIPGEKRKDAAALYKGLLKIKELAEKEGEGKTSVLLAEGKRIIEGYPGIELQYMEIVGADTLAPLKKIEGKALVLGAIKIAGIRLIDNIFINGGQDIL